MESDRYVVKFQSVFDLRIKNALGLKKGLVVRILFAYDGEKRTRKYSVMGKALDEELKIKIRQWLHRNISTHYIIYHIKPAVMQADSMNRRDCLI